MGITIRNAGIDVSIARETRAPSQRGFGSMAFITAVLSITTLSKLYGSVEEVAADYPSPSEEATAAAFWFAQAPAPEFFYVIQNRVAALPTKAKGSIGITGNVTAPGSYGIRIDSEQYLVDGLAIEVPEKAAIGSFDLSASANAAGDGTVGFEINTVPYSITPAAGDTATDMALALMALIAADGSAEVTADAISGHLELEAIAMGAAGNTITVVNTSTDSLASAVVEQLRDGADLIPGGNGAGIVLALAAQINAAGKYVATTAGTMLTIENAVAGTAGNAVTFAETTPLGGITAAVTNPAGGTDMIMDQTITETLDAALSANADFYAVSANRQYRIFPTAIEAAAIWVEANERLFFTVSNDPSVLETTASGDIASVLQAVGYTRTYLHYSSHKDEYPEIGAFALLATTSFRGSNTLKTLKFKKVNLASREILTVSQLEAIRRKDANVIFETAGIHMIDAGRTTSGGWIDEIHGTDALAEEIRVRVFGLLARTSTKVPYTEEGMALLKSEVIGSLNQYRRNGFLAEGVDEFGDFLDAFEVTSSLVSNAPITDKAARIAPEITFWARVSGAIHSVTITGRLIL